MICLYCGREFEGKRADAKFCCVKCRVAHNRNRKAVTDTDKRTMFRCPDCGRHGFGIDVHFDGPLYRFSERHKQFIRVQ